MDRSFGQRQHILRRSNVETTADRRFFSVAERYDDMDIGTPVKIALSRLEQELPLLEEQAGDRRSISVMDIYEHVCVKDPFKKQLLDQRVDRTLPQRYREVLMRSYDGPSLATSRIIGSFGRSKRVLDGHINTDGWKTELYKPGNNFKYRYCRFTPDLKEDAIEDETIHSRLYFNTIPGYELALQDEISSALALQVRDGKVEHAVGSKIPSILLPRRDTLMLYFEHTDFAGVIEAVEDLYERFSSKFPSTLSAPLPECAEPVYSSVTGRQIPGVGFAMSRGGESFSYRIASVMQLLIRYDFFSATPETQRNMWETLAREADMNPKHPAIVSDFDSAEFFKRFQINFKKD